MKLTKKDFHWLYAFPIYILINSLRHQMANVLAIWLTGGGLLRFSLLPTFSPSGWLRFNTLSWTGGEEWLILAAPYFADLLTFTLFFVILLKVVSKRRWIFINLLILGMASPFFNSAYDYFSAIFFTTDVNRIIDYMPFEELVHFYFVLSLSYYLLASQYVLRNSATAGYYEAQAQAERRRIKQEKKQKKLNGQANAKNDSKKS